MMSAWSVLVLAVIAVAIRNLLIHRLWKKPDEEMPRIVDGRYVKAEKQAAREER